MRQYKVRGDFCFTPLGNKVKRCKAITKEGERCRKLSQIKGYCGTHFNKEYCHDMETKYPKKIYT